MISKDASNGCRLLHGECNSQRHCHSYEYCGRMQRSGSVRWWMWNYKAQGGQRECQQYWRTGQKKLIQRVSTLKWRRKFPIHGHWGWLDICGVNLLSQALFCRIELGQSDLSCPDEIVGYLGFLVIWRSENDRYKLLKTLCWRFVVSYLMDLSWPCVVGQLEIWLDGPAASNALFLLVLFKRLFHCHCREG